MNPDKVFMRADSPGISVIIPTLNEESTIRDCLNQFRNRTGAVEIIVSDGGSEDGTEAVVGGYEGVRFIRSPARGRAIQMNEGARASSGERLLFLHADTLLPEGWLDYVRASMDRGAAGGRFRFGISDPQPIYRWIEAGTNFRSRILGITYGDQAIYCRRDLFERIGGYPAIPIFEDSELANRLRKAGPFDWIDAPVRTSARRWERRGPMRTLLLTWTLRTLYIMNMSPETLSRFYSAVR
jgi:rSAM/selenodomain-associated transferase 2